MEELYALFCRSGRVGTDSRSIEPGALFFALRGASFDGNRFAADALWRGAAAVVVDRPEVVEPLHGLDRNQARERGFFVVDDSLEALQSLAAMHRRRLGIPVLAITGTNGKTTTKELVSAVMSCKYRVSATQGNFNNHIGVPLTILGMGPDTEFGIVEMGASARGEIAALCKIAAPDYGLVTNVGRAHLDGFGGEEGVRAAKGELYDYLSVTGGKAFVRSDDAVLMDMAAGRAGLYIIRYGSEAASGFDSVLPGDYNRLNVAAAVGVGRYFGVDEAAMRSAISEYRPLTNRSRTIRTARNMVVADCYNANPSSMRAALQWFVAVEPGALGVPGFAKAVVLGDMLELGRWSRQEHAAVLGLLRGAGLECAILVGHEFCAAAESVELGGLHVETYPDAASALDGVKALADRGGMVVLLKGSHGMALERFVDCF